MKPALQMEWTLGSLLLTLVACGVPQGGQAPTLMLPVEQTPATASIAAADEWLARGYHLKWQCQMTPQDKRPPSGHTGKTRTCNNAALLASAGSGEYPVGAAAVKELYDGDGKISGHAVSLRVAAGAGDERWFWFERTGAGDGGVPAIGLGDVNNPRTICVGCHSGAPRDFVWTRVL